MGCCNPPCARPFATHLDPARVVEQFTSVWRNDSVVLVEASDLERADAYGQFTTGAQHERVRRQALQRTDRLVGRLLEQVDLAGRRRAHGEPVPSVGSVGARYRGAARPGCARWIPAFTDDAARRVRRARRRRAHGARPVGHRPPLRDGGSADGGPRDHDELRGPTVAPRAGRRRRSLPRPTRRHDADHSGDRRGAARGGRGAAGDDSSAPPDRRLVSAGALLRSCCRPSRTSQHRSTSRVTAGSRRTACSSSSARCSSARSTCSSTGSRACSAVETALGVIVALHLLDAMTGGHLEFNTPLGYSATVGIRVAGLGNPTFAQLASAVVLLAGLLVVRDLRRGRRVAVALLAVTFLVLAAPFFGQSFGAALATAPAFLVFAWLVYGRRSAADARCVARRCRRRQWAPGRFRRPLAPGERPDPHRSLLPAGRGPGLG